MTTPSPPPTDPDRPFRVPDPVVGGPTYDVAAALRKLADARRASVNDAYASGCVQLGDELAKHLARYFPDPLDRETAGRAIILVVGGMSGLREKLLGEVGPAVTLPTVLNVGAVAGERLVNGRAPDAPS